MHQSGVVCYVYSTVSGGKKEEFKAPQDSPLFVEAENECYIQAIDDEAFGVDITVPREVVRQRGATAVRVTLSIDKDAVFKRHLMSPGNMKIYSFRCTNGPITKQRGFTFRKMTLDEGLVLTREEVARQLEAYGTIEVTVHLGHSRVVPRGQRRENNGTLAAHTASKSLIKQKGLTHSVNTPSLGECRPRGPLTERFTPLSKNALAAKFVFRYRSLLSLEVMKVIDAGEASRLEQSHQRYLRGQAPLTQASPCVGREHAVQEDVAHVNTKQGQKRKAATMEDEVEVSDMTDGDSPPKKLKSVPSPLKQAALAPIPFVQGQASSSRSAGTGASSRPPKRSAESLEKERLQLRLEEIEVKRRLLELEEADAGSA